ncbi:nucleotidyltransferase domain-containing protein [Sulfurimonas microaerophilic]|uniref:nucleotidyltransferase domain-containing protein n=1 Tax=Sulfurimonas microaerophilic TaxID=3058392 RepID=UPI0027148382|nr:nucleotidyltransferase [Sulfurimonas sp. hsl 1-7]
MTKRMSYINMDNIHWEVIVALTDKLKLSDSKYADAEKKYNAVSKWLHDSDNEIFKDSTIYPQGSVRLGTTVKPYGANEHDIDLVVHLPKVNKYYSSEYIHELIGDRLKDHDTYSSMLKPLKRGWRLNYAGDFHLDITPAIPDGECNNHCPINKHYAEFVPDSALRDWKSSNPRGYAEWFHKIDEKMPKFTTDSKNFVATFESRTIEDIPNQHNFKGVLKRTVQLLKRHRDIFFNEKHITLKEYSPISILITTLAAQAYEDILQTQELFDPVVLLKKIISDMKKFRPNENGFYYLANPTNLKENFAEKWNNSSLYSYSFSLWIEAVYNDIEVILTSNGLDITGKAINDAFGGKYGEQVIDSLTSSIDQSRETGLISGVFTLNEMAKPKVEKNTFFGA